MKHYDKYDLAQLINESYPELRVNSTSLQLSPYQFTPYDDVTLGNTNVGQVTSLYLGTFEFMIMPFSVYSLKMSTSSKGTSMSANFLNLDFAEMPFEKTYTKVSLSLIHI